MNEEAELIRVENGDANDPAPAFMPAPTGRLMQASLLWARRQCLRQLGASALRLLCRPVYMYVHLHIYHK
eukprot:scaffold11520_cov175-Isochrysis_galbana.AAC.2